MLWLGGKIFVRLPMNIIDNRLLLTYVVSKSMITDLRGLFSEAGQTMVNAILILGHVNILLSKLFVLFDRYASEGKIPQTVQRTRNGLNHTSRKEKHFVSLVILLDH